MVNRAGRRALQRGRVKPQPDMFTIHFTRDELVVLEEALALWGHQTREDLDGLDVTDDQDWALARGERIRQAVHASLEDRPWHDIAPQRDAPAG